MAGRFYTDEQRATAVARVLAGESRKSVGKSMGIPTTTVTRWCEAGAISPSLAARAKTISERIVELQDNARERLLQRLVDVAGQATNVRELAIAYGVLTDKALLAQGKPTTISGSSVVVPQGSTAQQLEEIADGLRARRVQIPVEADRAEG